MKAVFSERNLVIVVGVLLGLIYWNHKQRKEERIEKAVAAVAKATPPPAAKQTVARKSLSVANSTPPTATTQTNTQKAPVSSTTNTLDLCREFSSHKFLVHKKLLRPILTQGNSALVVPQDLQKCLTEKTNVVVLNFAGFDYRNPNPYFYSTIEPRVFVSTIEKDLDLKIALADSSKLHKLGFVTEASASKFYAEIFGPDSIKRKWSYISFSISDKNLETVTFFAPQGHPFAKTVKKENINPLLNAGAMVLDVRPSKNFKASHIDKAVSNPTGLKKLAQAALSVEEQKQAGYVIHPSILPKDKAAAIVVVNQNPKSFSSYNTLTQLAEMGYANLYFYWEGMDQWDGNTIVTPEKVEGLHFITYNDLKARFSSPDALVIDVRSNKSSKKKILPRNVHMPFSEQKNAFKDPLYRADGLAASVIQRNNERFTVGMPDLPANIRTLVMVGDHTYDWKPLKAGLIIPHNSNIRIEVYRDGYQGWKYLSNLESPLPKRIGLAKKDLPKAGAVIARNSVGTSTFEKNSILGKTPENLNDKATEEKKAKKKSKAKSVRTTRPDGTAYPKLNAPVPVKAK